MCITNNSNLTFIDVPIIQVGVHIKFHDSQVKTVKTNYCSGAFQFRLNGDNELSFCFSNIVCSEQTVYAALRHCRRTVQIVHFFPLLRSGVYFSPRVLIFCIGSPSPNNFRTMNYDTYGQTKGGFSKVVYIVVYIWRWGYE